MSPPGASWQKWVRNGTPIILQEDQQQPGSKPSSVLFNCDRSGAILQFENGFLWTFWLPVIHHMALKKLTL